MTLPNSKLGSHGVRIVAGCFSDDFFNGRASTNSRHAYPQFAQAVNSGHPQMVKNEFPLAPRKAKWAAKVRDERETPEPAGRFP